ncbi:MBL fold metallo-hydrolase [Ramlibacter henchirensis]|uniref:MBL fold metallo-hydrolase n=1 Tax=Ramlibacter henchirensis TaxID=204072 RepID=A0A4Z0C6L4_9BURK|nr:MBL fold metallo-hydrolase [Ramlibacter henchirensis]TFZ05729.1 MBL fold metallo-hydrolase [Ramlibacter henchirensis]
MTPTCVHRLPDPASSTCTYLLVDEASATAVLIDPVEEQVERDLGVLEAMRLRLLWILETHVHADHITGASSLRRRTGARIATPARCGVSGATRELVHGDRIHFGSSHVEALHTPGHTAGSMCFSFRSPDGGLHLFTGDTLLIGGCGRTDLQGGDAGAMYDSITRVLFAFPDDTLVWPGHDYGEKIHTTIGTERTSNPRVSGRTRDAFQQLMAGLRLPLPKRLEEAVPANLCLGDRGR